MRTAPAPSASLSALPRLLAVLSIGLALGGCAAGHPGQAAAQSTPAAEPGMPEQVYDGSVPIQKIPFHTGVSSATVERMAKQRACTGGEGASLITQQGPVEVYRMRCDNGKMFMARCELRQCRAM
jgi:hypothetical protein